MSCDSVMDSPGVEWNFHRGPLSTVAGILAGAPRNGESSGPLVRDGWPLCPCKAALQPQYWLGNLFCGFLLIFLTEGWAWLSPLTGVRGRNAATYPGLLGARQCAQCGAYMLADHVPGATAGKALLTPIYTRSRPEGQ